MTADTTERRTFRVGGDDVVGERLWTADFESADEFRVERQLDGAVSFDGDRLRVDCVDERGVTVWARREFPADLIVEYVSTPTESDGVETSRNLNCFFCAADDDEPLAATPRSGGYTDYHDWPNYVFTLTYTHSRLRRDPGFERVSELMLGVQPEERYEVLLVKRAGRIRAVVNGRLLHDWTDPDPHGAGWVGLRTYDTDVTYDRWQVYGI